MRVKKEVNRLAEVKVVGDFATVACLVMYVSYIGQIGANLNGHPVSPAQPIFAAINAALWVGYGWLKPQKDWRVIIANFPGIIFGILTALTAAI